MNVSIEKFKEDVNKQFAHKHGEDIIVSMWETDPYIDIYGDEVINVGVTKFNLTAKEIKKLPSEIHGVKCNYTYESKITFLNLPGKQEKHDELIGGISFGAIDVTVGTLGGIVWDRSTGDPYLLTNEHVVSNGNNIDPNHPPVGHPILQPGITDGGSYPDDLAGHLVAVGGMKAAALNQESHNCDAALVEPERTFSETYFLGLGEVTKKSYAQANKGEEVIKSGRTTGVKSSIVWATGVSANIGGMAWADPILMVDLIQVSPGNSFSQGGDSGSRVFKQSTMEPIGLLFAGGEVYSYVIKASIIEDTLNVRFNNEHRLWIAPQNPELLYVPLQGSILCFCNGNYPEVERFASEPAEWSVGPGLYFTWSSGENRAGGLELHSDGEYLGTSWVKCYIPSVDDEVERPIEIVEIDFFEQEEFTNVEVRDRSLHYLQDIPNDQITDLVVTRELSGPYTIDFTIPHDARGASSISRGRYIKAEGNNFSIDTIESSRDAQGRTILRCTCNHEFFESRAIPTAWREDYYSHFKSQYRLALFQSRTYRGSPAYIVPCCFYSSDEFYFIDRYMASNEEDSRLETFQRVFQVFGGDFFLWRNYAIALPYEAVLPAPNLQFEYGLNTHTIKRTLNEAELLTEVFGFGGTVGHPLDPYKLEAYRQASPHIKNFYRLPRVGYIDFGDITSHYELGKIVEQYMIMLERTRTSYQLTVAELKKIPDAPSGDYDIDIGKTVKVIDNDLGIEDTQRIIRYSYKPLEPNHPSQIVVGSKPKHMIAPVVPERNVRFHGALRAKDTGTGFPPGGSNAPRTPAKCFVSKDEPEFSRGSENDIWIQYEDE